MVLNQNEINVLAHMVENPQAWADHAESNLGVEKGRQAMEAKVARHQASHDSCLAEGNYKDRNDREADAEQAELDRWAVDLASAKAKRKLEISQKVAGLFNIYIDPHYLKKARHAAREKSTVTIPSSVVAFEDALTANQDTADTAIDALTTVKAVKNYTLTLPTLP
jgi:hypothetical protein|tara:strand:- start:18 stop:515 length:498 start_codon:yes stop_codon:yes gene_type:complete